MNFSRIFFRRSLAGNAEMPYLCTRNREATLLQKRDALRFATRQQKCCCDLWKSYITDCREVQGTIDHEAFFLSGKKLLRVKWIVPSNSTPKQIKDTGTWATKTENKQKSYLQWRVWSWLRMNASYRLNTCKSRGSGLKACFQCRRPAHGCVTRIKPASYSGIALRK